MGTSAGGYSRQGELLVPVVLFLGALGLYSLQWFYGPAYPAILGDVTATAAERVQAGDIPYRDFWTMYAPGSYYLLALLFSIFGNHILVGSVAASILGAAAVSLCYRLVYRLLGGILPALVCAGIFLAAIYAGYYYLNLGPYPPVIVLVLLALNFMVDFHRTGSMTSLFAAGLATGMAIIFKHDVGGYAAIAMTAGLIAGHYCKDTVASHAGVTVKFAIYAAGVAAVSLPVAIYFAVLAGPDMWRDLIVFPATDFRFSRGENYPGLWPARIHHKWWLQELFNFLQYLKFTIPFVMVVLAVITLVVAGVKKNTDYLPMGITFTVLYLLHYSSAHIQINTNIISMPLYATMLGAISYRIIDGNIRKPGRPLFRVFALAMAAVIFLAFFLKPFYGRVRNDDHFVTSVLPRIAGVSVPPEKNETLTKLAGFVNENIPPGKRIFIGLHRHDTTVIGDGSTYFILGRLNATRQDQLHPGIVDTAKVQREMIRDLQLHDVRYILLKQDVFKDEELDKLRKIWSVTLPESGSTKLDEYIRANYRKAGTIDQYEIWRKSGPGEEPAQ